MFLFVKNIRVTPGALSALKAAGTFGTDLVLRHQNGDWGEADEETRQQNERGVAGKKVSLLSIFILPRTGQVLWVITKQDHSYTIMMLPEEY